MKQQIGSNIASNIMADEEYLVTTQSGRRQCSSTIAWRSDGGFWFYGVAALILAGAIAVTVYFCRSMGGGMPMPGGWTMSMMWMRMPGQSWLGAGAMFMVMWFSMMVAMMLPCLVPMLLNCRRSLRKMGTHQLGWQTTYVAFGYFFLWSLVGAILFPVGVGLTAAEMRWGALAKCVPIATGMVVVLVGLLQFTPWKARQLNRCRDESGCDLGCSTNALSSWRSGMRMVVNCASCCIGLMTLLLVGGAMDLGVMAFVTSAIAVERLVNMPDRAARITGGVVILLGVAELVRVVVLK